MTNSKDEQPKDSIRPLVFKLEGQGTTKHTAESDLEKKAKELVEKYPDARETKREYDLQLTKESSERRIYHASDLSYDEAIKNVRIENGGIQPTVVAVTINAEYSVPNQAVTTSSAGGPCNSSSESSRTPLV